MAPHDVSVITQALVSKSKVNKCIALCDAAGNYETHRYENDTYTTNDWKTAVTTGLTGLACTGAAVYTYGLTLPIAGGGLGGTFVAGGGSYCGQGYHGYTRREKILSRALKLAEDEKMMPPVAGAMMQHLELHRVALISGHYSKALQNIYEKTIGTLTARRMAPMIKEEQRLRKVGAFTERLIALTTALLDEKHDPNALLAEATALAAEHDLPGNMKTQVDKIILRLGDSLMAESTGTAN